MAVLATFTERTSGVLTGTLKDETGTVVNGATVTSATVSLIDLTTGTVINSRNAQDALTNGLTISAQGAFAFPLTGADNTILGSRPSETHRIIFRLNWPTNRSLTVYYDLDVLNVQTVT